MVLAGGALSGVSGKVQNGAVLVSWHLIRLIILTLINDYCFVVALAFEPTRSFWSVATVAAFPTIRTAATLLPSCLERMWLVLCVVGRFPLKRNLPSFIIVIWRHVGIFSFLRAELCVIGGGSLESSPLGRVQMAAVFGLLHIDLLGDIVFIVLSLAIEFARFRPVVVLVGSHGLVFYLVWLVF